MSARIINFLEAAAAAGKPVYDDAAYLEGLYDRVAAVIEFMEIDVDPGASGEVAFEHLIRCGRAVLDKVLRDLNRPFPGRGWKRPA